MLDLDFTRTLATELHAMLPDAWSLPDLTALGATHQMALDLVLNTLAAEMLGAGATLAEAARRCAHMLHASLAAGPAHSFEDCPLAHARSLVLALCNQLGEVPESLRAR